MSKTIRKSHHYSITKKGRSSTSMAFNEQHTSSSDSNFSHGSNPNGDENIF
jgi:hypothetical protein